MYRVDQLILLINPLNIYLMNTYSFGYVLALYPLVIVCLIIYQFDSIILGQTDITLYIPITLVWCLISIIWANLCFNNVTLRSQLEDAKQAFISIIRH